MKHKEVLVRFTPENDPGCYPMVVYTDGTLTNRNGEVYLWKEKRSSSSGKIYIATYSDRHKEGYLIDYCAKKIVRALVERTLLGIDDEQ